MLGGMTLSILLSTSASSVFRVVDRQFISLNSYDSLLLDPGDALADCWMPVRIVKDVKGLGAYGCAHSSLRSVSSSSYR